MQDDHYYTRIIYKYWYPIYSLQALEHSNNTHQKNYSYMHAHYYTALNFVY